jgi:hypothetical protein
LGARARSNIRGRHRRHGTGRTGEGLSAGAVGVGSARAAEAVAGVEGGDVGRQEFGCDKVDFVKVGVLIQEQHTDSALAPDALLVEDGLAVAVEGVVAVRKGDCDVMPGVEFEKGQMLAERHAGALGLCVHERVHAKQLHVVRSAQELSSADFDQAAPRVRRLEVHPEGDGEDGRCVARREDGGREAGVVLVGSVGVENALADLA